MTYCKGRVGRLKTGADGAFTHMNTGILDKLEFPYPPIDLQNQFAAIVERVEDIKPHYLQSLTDLESLYDALSQKAFKGELDLSRVVLTAGQIETTEETKPIAAVITEIETKSAIELPAPDDLKTLTSPEGRKALIGRWLDVYLTQLSGSTFLVEEFMEAAQQRLWDLQEDETIELSVAEYDHIKDWVFRALENGRLTQNYDKGSSWVRIV
jgi:type I restriction enzyme S subunit